MNEIRITIGQKFLPIIKEGLIGVISILEGIVPKVAQWTDEHLPGMVKAFRSFATSLYDMFISSGILETAKSLFDNLFGSVRKGESQLSKFFATAQGLLGVLLQIANAFLKIIDFIVRMNNATGGLLVQLAVMALTLSGVYKTIMSLVALKAGVATFFTAMGTGAAGATGKVAGLAAAFGPLTIAIMAAVAAYQLLDWWATKIEQDVSNREQAMTSRHDMVRSGPLEEAKKQIEREQVLATELEALQREFAGGRKVGKSTDLGKTAQRIADIESELGYKKGTLGELKDYGQSVGFQEGTFLSNAIGELKAGQKIYAKREADAKKDTKIVNNNIRTTMDITTPVSAGGEDTARKTGEAVESMFNLHLRRVLLASV
jgi:hypothetical protein